MTFRRIIWMLVIGLLALLNFPAMAQDTGDLVQLTVEAGYDQYFRPNYWLPLTRHTELNPKELVNTINTYRNE